MAVAKGTWRHREACVEAKQSCECGVSVRCSNKNMDHFAPAWVVTVVISVWVFYSFVKDLLLIGMASWRDLSSPPLIFHVPLIFVLGFVGDFNGNGGPNLLLSFGH